MTKDTVIMTFPEFILMHTPGITLCTVIAVTAAFLFRNLKNTK